MPDRTEHADLAAFLASHREGRTAEQISTEFHELLDAVKTHGKKGQLVITVVIEPPANGVDSAPMPIAIESTLKAPKAPAQKSLYFLDDQGIPVRDDPRQMAIDFRTAPVTNTFKDA